MKASEFPGYRTLKEGETLRYGDEVSDDGVTWDLLILSESQKVGPSLGYRRPIRTLHSPVEEDGDEVFIPMPKHCTKWECDKAKLERQGKFVRCPKCRGSYGRMTLKEWSRLTK
jgi:hypothetical protein